jgi:Tfp pilus assembly protein PilN
MHPELTNLLPEDRQKELRRDYFYRLSTVSALMLIVLLAIQGALLIPTDQYLNEEIATRTQSLAALEATLASADEQNLDARLAILSEETSALGALATSTTESSVLTQLLAVPHPGVGITVIMLTPSHGRVAASGSVAGIADTRDDLRSYYLELSGATFIESANLPISAYAQATQIPFTITLVLP